MREFAKVVAAVAATELILWSVGVWSWVSHTVGRWPWLLDRYALIFPVILVILLLALRRRAAARSHFVAAVLTGAVAGLIASVLSLVVAQVSTAPERANFWNGLRLEGGVAAFLLFGSFSALFLTLGWLYGASASVLALSADRAERYYLQRSSERQAESPVAR